MQIAINGRFLSQSTTGVQRMAREFTRALDRLMVSGEFPGLEVRLLVQANADLSDLDLTAIRTEVVGTWRGHAWEQFVLPRHVKDAWLLNLGNSAPLISLAGKTRVAVVVHDISYRLFPDAYRLLYRIGHRLIDTVVMNCAHLIFTVAETERAMIARFYPKAADRLFVVQNGGAPDDEKPASPNGAPVSNERYGLYVGSFSRRKNVEVVIETAIALARTRGLRFKLVGASSPILQDIHPTLPEDVRSMIEFCGQIEDVGALQKLYRNAAFLLFPSLYEASALPPVEAMAQGCPVIASDIPSLRERCGDAAAYCDPRDGATILTAADQLLDNADLRAELIERGFRCAAQYSWRAQAANMISRLEKCAA